MIVAQNFPGMELIPLLFLSTVGGSVAGVLGVVVGLTVSKSRFAFWAGLVACAAGVGMAALIFLNGHLLPEAYVYAAIPLLPGLAAVALSFRPPVRLPAWAASNPARPLRFLADPSARVTMVLVLAALVAVYYWIQWSRPRWDFDALLHGSNGVEVASVVIKRPDGTIVLDDPESARYLTAALRSVRRESLMGATYYAEVHLATGGFVMVAFFVPDDGNRIGVSWPLDSLNDPDYYLVHLPYPMPVPVAEAIRQLR